MNTLNFNRIKLLLLADWHEFKLHILLAVIAVPAIALPMSLYFFDFDVNFSGLFNFAMLISIFLTANYANNRANQTKGLGFLTPASPLEKYLAIWIGMILIVIVSILLYVIIFSTHSIFITESTNNNILKTINVPFIDSLSDIILALYLYSFWFLGMITFREKAFFKTVLFFGFFLILLSLEKLSSYEFVSYFLWENYSYVGVNYTHNMENIYPGVLALVEYKNYILSLLILVNIYIGYLKLKEKVL